MENKNTHCVNPYLNLSVHSAGKLKPCCMSTKFYSTDNGDQVLNQASILEFWNSKDRQQVIDDLNNGIKIPSCDACWREEAAGKESKRIRDNKTYENVDLSDNMLPVVVDISLGNLCNLKCRICNPGHSSPWIIEEANRLYPNNKDVYFSNQLFVDIKESFADDNTLFWNDIVDLLPNAKKIDIAGGEPFYINNQWILVKQLVNNGYSKNQHIHYNTNGTIFPTKHIDDLNTFKIVDIQISSDGVGKKFEYMRHPAAWNEVESNIDKFCKIRDENPHWMIGVCLSVSAFNVYDFFETFEYYASKNIHIYVNTVHDHRGIRILPAQLKKEIIQKLTNTESKYKKSQWEKEKSMICRLLENTTESTRDWKEFCREIKIRDEIRNESFEETFPEYHEIIKRFIE